MTLSEFLDLPNQSATALAAKVGCEVSTITRWARGERRPSLEFALLVEAATDGAVTPRELLNISTTQPGTAA